MRVSITALETYLSCPHRYHLKQSWRAPPEEKSRPLQIGSLVSEAIEKALMMSKEPAPRAKIAQGVVGCCADSEVAAKAHKVLTSMPDWLWEVQVPISEDRLEVYYGKGDFALPPRRITISGRPDIWYIEYAPMIGEGDHPPEPLAIHVVELKTGGGRRSDGGRKLEGYETYGIQALRYCVLLYDVYEWLRPLPFYRQHIYLGTEGYCLEGARHHVSPATMDIVRTEMVDLAAQVGQSTVHNWDRFQCGYCEFGPACMADLTGQSEYAILQGEYTHKEEL